MAERIVDKAILNKERIEQYLKFVDEQMYSLSRLDNMLRTNEKMLFSESFSRGGSNYMMNNPIEDEDDEDEEVCTSSFVPQDQHLNQYVALQSNGLLLGFASTRKELKAKLGAEPVTKEVCHIYFVEQDSELIETDRYDVETMKWEKL